MDYVTYALVEDRRIKERVYVRQQATLAVLKSLGFEGPAFYSEQTLPFGLLFFFPIFWAMRAKHEVVCISGLLAFTTYYALMRYCDKATFVLVDALGVKFYTGFTDGSAVISTNQSRVGKIDEAEKFYKYAMQCDYTEVWTAHQLKVEEFKAAGKSVVPGNCFGDYVQLSSREDALEKEIVTKTATILVRVVLFLMLIALRIILPIIFQ